MIYLVKKNFTQEDSIDIGVTVDGIDEDVFVNISFVYGGFVFADRNCRDTPSDFIQNIGGLISTRVWMALILANMIFICHYTAGLMMV